MPHDRTCGCGRAAGREPFAAPGTPVRRPPDRAVDVLHVFLDVAVDLKARSLAGEARHRLRVAAEEISSFALDAVGLRITSTALDGVPVPFVHDGERLIVRPRTPLKRGRECVLSVVYDGSPTRGLWFVAPDAFRPDKPLQAWTQGQDEDARYWFPCFDHPQHKAPTELRATVPADCVAVSNGALIGRETRGGRAVFHWSQRAPHPVYLVTLVVGRFDVVEDRAGDVPLAYYVPEGRRGDALRTFGRTPEMIATFGRLFGAPYPFEKYDQLVVSDFIFGGMENTSATTLYEYVLLDPSVEAATDSEWLVAHELGHQWFGDLLTCRDWPDAWLNEGFATYAEVLWYEFGHDADRGRRHLLETARGYFEEARDQYRRPIVCATYEAPTDLFDRHLYEKGACVLHHLRTEVGDAAFFRSVAEYVRVHREGSVETVDLRRAFERETGRSLETFFKQWVEAPGHPEFEVRHAWDAETRRLVLTVRQTQRRDDGTPIFSARVRCRAWLASGFVDRTFDVVDAEQRLHWDLPEDPLGVRFAADGAPLFAIDFARPEGWLVTQLERDEDLLGRVEAADDLASARTTTGVAALVRAFAAEKRTSHKIELAAALGRAGTTAAREALAAGLKSADARVRAAVVAALGSFRDAEAAEALAAHAAREKVPLVRAHALKALGRAQAAGYADRLRAAVDERGVWNDVTARFALDGLGELRRAEDVDVLRAALAKDRPDLVRAAAARALGEASPPPEGRAAVREALVKLLDEGFHVARAAVQALRSFGDAKAIPALERLASARMTDGRLKRLARGATRSLRDGGADRERVAALRERVDRAEADLKRLAERVDGASKRTARKSASRPAKGRRAAKGARRPRRR